MQSLHQVYSFYSSWKEIPLIASAAAALEKFHEVALVMSASHASASASGASDDSPPHISDAQFKQYFASDAAAPESSESSDDRCGPHQECCGGAVCNGSYTSCVRRLGKGGLQHQRGQVCLSMHKHFQCATCHQVAHSGCWVRTAKGSFMLPSAFTSFHCFTCASKQPVVAVMSTNNSKQNQQTVAADMSTSSSTHTAQPSADMSTNSSTPTVQETERTFFMSEEDTRKHFKARNWRCYNSTASRIYYCCRSKKCDVKFTAIKNPRSDDDTWWISKMPTCHSCSDSAKPTVATSLVTLKDHLSETLVKEIESLGVTKSFRSKQIQHHLLSSQQVLVDTKLIHNIVYRVRQKLFGPQGDMIYLLEQQQVAFMCLCTQALLPSFVLILVKGWLC